MKTPPGSTVKTRQSAQHLAVFEEYIWHGLHGLHGLFGPSPPSADQDDNYHLDLES